MRLRGVRVVLIPQASIDGEAFVDLNIVLHKTGVIGAAHPDTGPSIRLDAKRSVRRKTIDVQKVNKPLRKHGLIVLIAYDLRPILQLMAALHPGESVVDLICRVVREQVECRWANGSQLSALTERHSTSECESDLRKVPNGITSG